LALGINVSIAHPTFETYFVLTVPFLGILAAVGLFEISTRLGPQSRPFWPVLILTALLCLGLAKALYEKRDDLTWPDLEKVAGKVDQVTPPQARLLADEHIYFLTRRPPRKPWLPHCTSFLERSWQNSQEGSDSGVHGILGEEVNHSPESPWLRHFCSCILTLPHFGHFHFLFLW